MWKYLCYMNNADININHPSFVLFLDKITNTILSTVPIENYFALTNDKKINVQYLILKLMKNSLKASDMLSDAEIKSFIIVLLKKNEEAEHYELAGILRDMLLNFDTVHDMTKSSLKGTKSSKTEVKNKNNA